MCVCVCVLGFCNFTLESEKDQGVDNILRQMLES